MEVRVARWTESPQMSPGAPEPRIFYDGHSVLCAYESRDGDIALVRFEGVLYCKIGYPNDEMLKVHELYKHGLEMYAFNLVENSPLIRDLDKVNEQHNRHKPGAYLDRFKHWVVTFHDETLEVLASSASVVSSSGNTQHEAIVSALRIQRT